MADLEALVRHFADTQNADDVDGLVNCYAENGARVGQGRVTRGRDNLRALYTRIWKALTNRRLTLDKIVVSGRTAVIEYTERATHSAPLATPFGELAPSNKQFDIHGAAFLEFDGDKIAEVRVHSDALFQMLLYSPSKPTVRS